MNVAVHPRAAVGGTGRARCVASTARPFPAMAWMKPEQQEIERLRRELAKLKAERDILRKAAAYFAKDSI